MMAGVASIECRHIASTNIPQSHDNAVLGIKHSFVKTCLVLSRNEGHEIEQLIH